MKNRGKNGRETNSSRSTEYITVNIDYDKLSNAIVSAHGRIESKKQLAEEESTKTWRKNLGWVDYSHERNIFKRKFLETINWIVVFYRILSTKNKYTSDMHVTNSNRPFIKLKPKSIIIGLRTSDEDAKNIIIAAHEAGITDIRKMCISINDDLEAFPVRIRQQ